MILAWLHLRAEDYDDLDGDGLYEIEENAIGTSDSVWDFDSDGFSDGEEFYAGSDPTDPGSFPGSGGGGGGGGGGDMGGAVDSDLDGLSDEEEAQLGTDPSLGDTDGEGLSDFDEVFYFFTDPTNADTDGDGRSDFDEIQNLNSNPFDPADPMGASGGGDSGAGSDSGSGSGDGSSDSGGASASAGSGEFHIDDQGDQIWVWIDLQPADSDDDGLSDDFEEEFGYDPNDPANGALDSDGDGLPDDWELAYGFDPFGTPDGETDHEGDGLDNLTEFQNAADPLSFDSDEDGLDDALEAFPIPLWPGDPLYEAFAPAAADGTETAIQKEVWIWLHPAIGDLDGDRLPDGWEFGYGLNPLAANAAEDPDGDERPNLLEWVEGTNPMAPDRKEVELVAGGGAGGVGTAGSGGAGGGEGGSGGTNGDGGNGEGGGGDGGLPDGLPVHLMNEDLFAASGETLDDSWHLEYQFSQVRWMEDEGLIANWPMIQEFIAENPEAAPLFPFLPWKTEHYNDGQRFAVDHGAVEEIDDVIAWKNARLPVLGTDWQAGLPDNQSLWVNFNGQMARVDSFANAVRGHETKAKFRLRLAEPPSQPVTKLFVVAGPDAGQYRVEQLTVLPDSEEPVSNEVIEIELFSESGRIRNVWVWEAPITKMRLDPDTGEFWPADFELSPSDPRPEIRMDVTNVSFDQETRNLQVTVNGTVRDVLSEFVSKSENRISELRFFINGRPEPEPFPLQFAEGRFPPFTRVDSRNSFEYTFVIPKAKPGGYHLRVETDANAFGHIGWDHTLIPTEILPEVPDQNAEFNPEDSILELGVEPSNGISISFDAAPSSDTVDSIAMYAGNRDVVEEDPRSLEVSAQSLRFEGSIRIGETSYDADFKALNEPTLTSEVIDQIRGLLTLSVSGVDQVFYARWVETAANSLQFYPEEISFTRQVKINSNEVPLVVGIPLDLAGSQPGHVDLIYVRVENLPGDLINETELDYEWKHNGQIQKRRYAIVGFEVGGEIQHFATHAGWRDKPRLFLLGPVPDNLDGEAVDDLYGDKAYEILTWLRWENPPKPPPLPGIDKLKNFTPVELPDEAWWKPERFSIEALAGREITEKDLYDAYRFIYTGDDVATKMWEAFKETCQTGQTMLVFEDFIGEFSMGKPGKWIGPVIARDPERRFGEMFVIRIDHDDRDMNPAKAAQFLRAGLSQALVEDWFFDMVKEKLNTPEAVLELYIERQQEALAKVLRDATVASKLYFAAIGIVHKGGDWIMVVSDLIDGDLSTLAAVIPIIPRGLIAAGKNFRIAQRSGTIVDNFDSEQFAALRRVYENSWERADQLSTALVTPQFRTALQRSGQALTAPAKRTLRTRLAAVSSHPGSVDIVEFYDFPWRHRKWFAKHGFDVTDPNFGRWISAKEAKKWSAEHDKFWDDFIAAEQANRPYSANGIRYKLNESRTLFPTTTKYVRSSPPKLPDRFKLEFDGEVQLKTYSPGERLYRSRVFNETQNNPGRWFGTRQTTTVHGTDSMYQINKVDNPIEILRTYEFKVPVTVYHGRVKGGTGYQAYIPDDITTSEVLKFIDEKTLTGTLD